MAQEELSDFLLTMSIGLFGALVVCVAIMLWRLVRRRPIVPQARTLNSPGLFYAGIALFGALAIMSFAMKRPLFGSFLSLGFALSVLGLIAFRRGWIR